MDGARERVSSRVGARLLVHVGAPNGQVRAAGRHTPWPGTEPGFIETSGVLDFSAISCSGTGSAMCVSSFQQPGGSTGLEGQVGSRSAYVRSELGERARLDVIRFEEAVQVGLVEAEARGDL